MTPSVPSYPSPPNTTASFLKKCCRCHILKCAEDFVKSKNRKDGLHPLCKNCSRKGFSDLCPLCGGIKRKKSKRCAECLEKSKVASETNPFGHCAKCSKYLPASAFRKHKSKRNGLDSWCKACLSSYYGAKAKEQRELEKLQPTRTCNICNTSKPSEEFNRHRSGKVWTCKECLRAPYIARTHKSCSMCKMFLSVDRFSKNKKSLDGITSACKDCISIVSREARGLPSGWYGERLALQQGRCAICQSDKPTKNKGHGTTGFHVDHNHSCCPSGRYCSKCIRGLLCDNCNKLLGHLENIEWLKKALSYMHTFSFLLNLQWVDENHR